MATVAGADPDWAIRHQAFSALERLSVAWGGEIPWQEISRGFEFQGGRIHFANRPRGIFKPQQMSAALSVKTTKPRSGRRTRYRDQEGDYDDSTGLVRYDLADGGMNNPSNRHLRLAAKRGAPLIYFRGIRPRVYEAIWPVWVEHFLIEEQQVLLAAQDLVQGSVSSVKASADTPLEDQLVVERRYSTRQTRYRNHQAWFSSRTKSAYGYRCAFSGLPLRDLLVGAHIVADSEGGPASVTNGICMSTLHHAAFDEHFIGVDPDLRVHVAPMVTKRGDGPLLESIKALQGTVLRIPRNPRARPNSEYLERRFLQFRNAAG